MAVKLRLARHGAKKRPYYRLVAADQRFARDGRFLEHIGSYDPNHNPPAVTLKRERIQYWLDQGAQVSPTVGQLLAKHLGGEDVSGSRKSIPVDPPAPEVEAPPVEEAAKAAPAEEAAEAAPAEKKAPEAAPAEEKAVEAAPVEEKAPEAAPAEKAPEAAPEEKAVEAAPVEEKAPEAAPAEEKAPEASADEEKAE